MNDSKNSGWTSIYLLIVAALVLQVIVYYGITIYFQ
jgi:hypothetical protein